MNFVPAGQTGYPVRYYSAGRVTVTPALSALSSLPASAITRVSLDESKPDVASILPTLQMFVEQFGRDPFVRSCAEQIITTRRNNDISGQIAQLTEWVKTHLVYMADPDGAEYIQSPVLLLQRIANRIPAYGDCDDHVLLLGALLASVGVQVRAVAVRLNQAPNFNHVILEAVDPMAQASIRTIDPCAKSVSAPQYADRLIA